MSNNRIGVLVFFILLVIAIIYIMHRSWRPHTLDMKHLLVNRIITDNPGMNPQSITIWSYNEYMKNLSRTPNVKIHSKVIESQNMVYHVHVYNDPYFAKLTFLEDFPVRNFEFLFCPGIQDLASIGKSSLISAHLVHYEGNDLYSLSGSNLKCLALSHTPNITDISAIAGLDLLSLTLNYTEVSDLSSISNMHLNAFCAVGSKIEDLSPLSGHPLDFLILSEMNITDLTFLSNHHGQFLYLFLTDLPLDDLSPIRDLRIESLTIRNTCITDLRCLLEENIGDIDVSLTYEMIEQNLVPSWIINSYMHRHGYDELELDVLKEGLRYRSYLTPCTERPENDRNDNMENENADF